MPGLKWTEGVTMTDETLRDLVKVTHSSMPFRGQIDFLFNLHKFDVINRWFPKAKEGTGTYIEWKIKRKTMGNARMKRPFATDSVNLEDTWATCRLPWRYSDVPIAYEDDELQTNVADPNRWVDLIKSRRGDAKMDMAEMLEDLAWLAPVSTSDDLNPHGLAYWLPPVTSTQQTNILAGTTTPGHIVTNPSGFTDTAGLDASAAKYARWKSYGNCWSNATFEITEDDITKIVWMHEEVKFEVPQTVDEFRKGIYSQYQGYAAKDCLKAMQQATRGQNDNLGADLGIYGGSLVVKGTPVGWCEQLDTPATKTLLLVNHNYFYPVVFKGGRFKESTPRWSDSSHNVLISWIDLKWNIICQNRQLAGGRIDRI